MPRVYKPKPGGKRYTKYDQNLLQQAVQEYLTENSSVNTISAKYNIKRSTIYLHSRRHLSGRLTVLSPETEEYLVKYLNICAEWDYPLRAIDIRYIVKIYLDKAGICEKRFKNNLPGPDFIGTFLRRNKDSIVPHVTKRCKKFVPSVSINVINKYFDLLENCLKNIPKSNIVCYDESCLSDNLASTNVVTRRKHKYTEEFEKSDASRACVSIILAGSVDGKLLPPYFVYQTNNLFSAWMSDGPQGAEYNCSPTGWSDGAIFEDWVQTIIIPFFSNIPGEKILIGDYISTHLSVDTIQLCKEHNINFIFLPNNSTFLMQPLYAALFVPMTVAWQQILLQWKTTDGISKQCVPKSMFSKLLKELMQKIEENSESNLLSGFKRTGISPLNRSEVLSRVGTTNKIYGSDEHSDGIDDSVISTLNYRSEAELEIGQEVSVGELSEEDYYH